MSDKAIVPDGIAGARAETGDLIVIEGHHIGESRRLGEILEVIGDPGSEHYRVRWEDGRETLFYASNDATIQRAKAPSGRSAVKKP